MSSTPSGSWERSSAKTPNEKKSRYREILQNEHEPGFFLTDQCLPRSSRQANEGGAVPPTMVSRAASSNTRFPLGAAARIAPSRRSYAALPCSDVGIRSSDDGG